jgi:serine/threonine protein phosphatase PrpC
MAFRMEAYALTDVGLMRDHNEDAFDVMTDKQIFVVADGMGGHASGQVASRLSIENMRLYSTQLVDRPGHEYTFPVLPGCSESERMLSNAIQWANERIFIESMKDRKYEGMGTTIVAGALDGDRLVLGHVGDSRIYRFRDGQLEQVTRDHSLLNHYIDQGKITTEEESRNFRERNIIVKALGLKDYVEPTVGSTDVALADVFLLCSDGLTDQVEDWVIANVLDGNDDLADACQALIRLSNEAGGKDNCTVMLLRVWDADSAPKDSGTQPSMQAVTDEEVEEATAPDVPAMVDDEIVVDVEELPVEPQREATPVAVTAMEEPPPIPSAAVAPITARGKRLTMRDSATEEAKERDSVEARKRIRTTIPLGTPVLKPSADDAEQQQSVRTTIPLGMPALKIPAPDSVDEPEPVSGFDDSDFNFDDRIDE